MVVSIDIGTSYSSICMLGADGRTQPIDISTGTSMFGGKFSLPTAVFVEDNGKVLVGQAAMNSRKSKPQNFRMEFKRNLGEDIPILLGERSFHPEELYTEIFRHMKACAEKVGGEPIEKAYLTCPASYGERRKEKLRSAAKAAGIFDVELVDEPTAAAMCYCAGGYLQDGQIVLVYDFGGGTFDVSLIRYQNGSFELLAEPEGLEQCGGIDMDRLIYQDMLASVEPDVLDELKGNNLHYLRFTSQLAELAVKAKHHLTAAEVFEEYIQIGFDMVPYQLTVEKFEEMIAPLVGQTIQTCRQAMDMAGVDAPKLSAVLMVGGTSRVPLVREMAKKIAVDARLLCAVDLELAVAQGALEYQAYALAKTVSATSVKALTKTELAVPVDMEKSGEDFAQEYYEKGEEAYRNELYEEAVWWYQKAAELGHAHAEYMLGRCYSYGRGVVKDAQQGIQCYHKAAQQGDVEAMEYLGNCYKYGEGVPKDEKQSYQWYEKAFQVYHKAALQGDKKAMYVLGFYLETGKGVTQILGLAIHWYQKAAKAGSKAARDILMEMDEGLIDSSGAVSLSAQACYNRGEKSGRECAVQWYQKAAEMGHANAAYKLGEIYEYGRYEVTPNKELAIQWYRKAAALGNYMAKFKVLRGRGF